MNITATFDNIYRFLGHLHPEWKNNIIVKILRNVIRIIANIVLPTYYRLTANRPCNSLCPIPQNQQDPLLIVSLTSFPVRIHQVWMVIESIIRQTHKPDKIILWLSKDQFPHGLQDLPQSILRLRRRGLDIEFREGDIRSHKKHYYNQTEYPNDIMITIDDDIFYSPKIIEYLYETHKKHPNAIIANRCHQMTFDKNGNIQPYAKWNYESTEEKNLFAIGVGGILYPPHSLHKDVTNISMAMETCPVGDDIWLNAMARMNNSLIIHSNMKGFTGLSVIIPNNVNLCDDNVMDGTGNDHQIKALQNALNTNIFNN